MAFTYRGIPIPDASKAALDAWTERAAPPGKFLTAVLVHDLVNAALNATDAELAALPVIVVYLHNEMPSNSYGSWETLHAWMHARKAVPA